MHLNAPRFTHAESTLLPGTVRLEVENVSGLSTVTSAFATSPMKLLTPRARGESVWAFTSNFGGGMVAGDRTCLNVRLGEDCTCFVGTQASSKVYRTVGTHEASHRTDAMVGPRSLLVFAPDPIQAFQGASYRQEQTFRLAGDASLVLLDWVSAGRTACGERWAFRRFQSRNQVFRSGERHFFDSILLDSEGGPLDSAHRLGRFNCLAMLLVVGPSLEQAARNILQEVSNEAIVAGAPVLVSVSPLHKGALLRLTGESLEEVTARLRTYLQFMANVLGEDPWSRRP